MTGGSAQDMNLMAWLEIAAGAACVARVWRRDRLIGATLMGCGLVILAQPALADQTIIAADNGTVACEASLKDLTRIALKGDQFASVSKVQSGNPAEDFQVVNEPSRGDIYLSVGSAYARPTLSFFGITRKGYVYKFVCTVGGADARQVFVANAEIEQPRAVGERWPAGLSASDTAGRLIAAMYAQKPVEGYDVSWHALAPVNVGTLKVQLVGTYRGHAYLGKLLKLTNGATKPVTLSEDAVGPADAIAISITKASLAPDEATTAFVVEHAPASGDQP